MNILYYLGNYPKLSESWVRNEIRELTSRGHNVAVFSHHAPDDSPEDFVEIPVFTPPEPSIQGVTELNFKKILTPEFYRSLSWSNNPLRHAYSIYYASYASSYVDSLPFDIEHIHGHFATPPQVPAQYLSRLLGVPHSMMTHANDLYEFDHVPTRQFLYQNVDCLLTISEYNREKMKKESNHQIDVDVLPACFDADEFEPSNGFVGNRIVSVARHVEKKGISYAIRAIAGLDIPVEYRLIGDGPQTGSLIRLSEDLGISDQVQFLGRVSRDRLRQELDEAQLFLLPCIVANSGDRDGIPVSIKEAMAMGTPPVTTNVSGLPELVDESCGYLATPKDVDSLQKAIENGLTEISGEKAKSAQERIQSHSSDIVVDRLIEKFRNTVDKED